jgi:hypothetical protein
LTQTNGRLAAELDEKLTKLILALPSRNGGVGEIKARIRIYQEDLAGLPADKVGRVLDDYRLGELGDGRWCPTSAEIRRAVMARIDAESEWQQANRRQAKIDAETLAARERREKSAEEIEAVARMTAAFSEAADKSRRAEKRRGGPTEDEAKAYLARHAAGFRPPPVETFSEKLVAQLYGEYLIGEGKLGKFPMATLPPEDSDEASDEAI